MRLIIGILHRWYCSFTLIISSKLMGRGIWAVVDVEGFMMDAKIKRIGLLLSAKCTIPSVRPSFVQSHMSRTKFGER
jgi:hypothetical protein